MTGVGAPEEAGAVLALADPEPTFGDALPIRETGQRAGSRAGRCPPDLQSAEPSTAISGQEDAKVPHYPRCGILTGPFMTGFRQE